MQDFVQPLAENQGLVKNEIFYRGKVLLDLNVVTINSLPLLNSDANQIKHILGHLLFIYLVTGDGLE